MGGQGGIRQGKEGRNLKDINKGSKETRRSISDIDMIGKYGGIDGKRIKQEEMDKTKAMMECQEKLKTERKEVTRKILSKLTIRKAWIAV